MHAKLGAEAPMDAAFAHCGRAIAGFNWTPPANLAPGTYEIYLKLIDFPHVTSNRLPITILNPNYVDPNPTPEPTPEPSATPTPEPSEPPGEEKEPCPCGLDGLDDFSIQNIRNCQSQKCPARIKIVNGPCEFLPPNASGSNLDSVYTLYELFDFDHRQSEDTRDITAVIRSNQHKSHYFRKDIVQDGHDFLANLLVIAPGFPNLKINSGDELQTLDNAYREKVYADQVTDSVYFRKKDTDTESFKVLEKKFPFSLLLHKIPITQLAGDKEYWEKQWDYDQSVTLVGIHLRLLPQNQREVDLTIRLQHPVDSSVQNQLRLRLTRAASNKNINWESAKCL